MCFHTTLSPPLKYQKFQNPQNRQKSIKRAKSRKFILDFTKIRDIFDRVLIKFNYLTSQSPKTRISVFWPVFTTFLHIILSRNPRKSESVKTMPSYFPLNCLQISPFWQKLPKMAKSDGIWPKMTEK